MSVHGRCVGRSKPRPQHAAPPLASSAHTVELFATRWIAGSTGAGPSEAGAIGTSVWPGASRDATAGVSGDLTGGGTTGLDSCLGVAELHAAAIARMQTRRTPFATRTAKHLFIGVRIVDHIDGDDATRQRKEQPSMTQRRIQGLETDGV
jgi:hypothetical protein